MTDKRPRTTGRRLAVFMVAAFVLVGGSLWVPGRFYTPGRFGYSGWVQGYQQVGWTWGAIVVLLTARPQRVTPL